MKGAVAMELEPLTTIPSTPAGNLVARKSAATIDKEAAEADKAELAGRSETVAATARPAVAIVTPVSQRTSLASIEPNVQKRRDNERRKILEEELSREEESLTGARSALTTEQQNPQLVAAVRAAQQATDPSPAQLVEMRNNIDKASGRIRGLQATVAEHEKNIEALKKELGALKP
jgi:chromosome segregation ATPase